MENFEVVQHMLDILGIERRDVSDTEYSKLKSFAEKHVAEEVRKALERVSVILEKCGCLDCCCSGVESAKLIREIKEAVR